MVVGGVKKKRCTSGRVCEAERRDWAWAVEKHVERMETRAVQRPDKRKRNSSPAGMMDTQESQRATGSGGVGEMEWDEGRRCVPARYYGPYIQATDTSRWTAHDWTSFLRWTGLR